jgi:hypothetical protein
MRTPTPRTAGPSTRRPDLDTWVAAAFQLADLRRDLHALARRFQLSDDDAGRLLFAVGEVVTDALVRDAIPVRVRWYSGATSVRIRVDEAAGPHDDPGDRRRRRGAAGAALWMAHHVAAVTLVHTGPRTTTHVSFPAGSCGRAR